jgi:DNA-binding MarR family transcriptional regulator/energy-coupling factor transporter ATP-binding protein EcfA2
MALSLADRLLKLLCEQPESLASAWDVPRNASLPGLSERLGVVRSALHGHIKNLQESGFILTRQAHVIGGGSRKRTVIHPTLEGRKKASSIIVPSSQNIGKIVGNFPDLVEIVGRDESIESISTMIHHGESLILTGLPGIGKTALVRCIVQLFVEQGQTVRWMRFDADSDSQSVGNTLIGPDSPSTLEAIVGMLPEDDIIVLDEIQEVHSRHLQRVEQLCNLFLERGRSILISRAPVPLGINGESVRIDGLSAESARTILGDRVDDQLGLEIVSALGGHPLAIGLWSPDDSLPTASDAVMSFVQETVLDHLSSKEKATFDELAISPIPLQIDELSRPEKVSELDDRALIRWHSDEIEGQHLIENVRKETWSEEEKVREHRKLADWWSSRDGARARRIELHHRIESNDLELPSLLLSSLDTINFEIPAASVILIEDALKQHPNHFLLRIAATQIAIDRAELDIASKHLDLLENSPEKRYLNSRIMRINDDINKADEEEEEALLEMDDEGRLRYGLASIVRQIDDHLPGKFPSEEATDLLKKLEIFESSLSSDNPLTPPARTAVSIATFRIYLATGSISEASMILNRLTTIAGPRDPIVRRLRLRLDIVDADQNEIVLLSARIEAEPNIVERSRLLHSLIDSLDEIPPALIAAFERSLLTTLPEHTTVGRRLLASRWRIVARIDRKNAIHALQESVHLYRISGCRNVANQLLAEAHRLI